MKDLQLLLISTTAETLLTSLLCRIDNGKCNPQVIISPSGEPHCLRAAESGSLGCSQLCGAPVISPCGTKLGQCCTTTRYHYSSFFPPVSGMAACCQELKANGEITMLKIATLKELDIWCLGALPSFRSSLASCNMLQTNLAFPLSTGQSQIATAFKCSISN